MPRHTLEPFVDRLQSSGRYTFTREEALRATDATPVALKFALGRLKKKRRIAMPRRGFYVIVPAEYRSAGTPPPEWFIDDLMRSQHRPYYCALLTAAALHGASHQQPQQFQVMSDRPIRPIRLHNLSIRFIVKRNLQRTPSTEMKTPTGRIRVSSPEATVIDLISYARRSGHLPGVVTVLSELRESVDARRLVAAAKAMDLSTHRAQRLGYVLDRAGGKSLTHQLHAWIQRRGPRCVALHPGRARPHAIENRRWRVVAGEAIEPET